MKLLPQIELAEVLDNPLHPFHEMVVWWADEQGTHGASYRGSYVTRPTAQRCLQEFGVRETRENLDQAVRMVHRDKYQVIRIREIPADAVIAGT